MDKVYDHKKYEEKIYEIWEKSGVFTPKIDKKKKPFTIVLPPPNASGKMHVGNVLMIAIEDLLIRVKRMQGFSALWVPGTDHAGFETQITFERELKQKNQSRFDFDRETLYKKIWDFVQENKHLIENQIRQMGASVDWTRYKFTLDTNVIDTVTNTFNKMAQEGLVYRDDYMVNFCPVCGTTFADLEVRHKERIDPLYFIKYKIVDSDGFITVATVRPETLFGDAAIAVNPKDKRYLKLAGKKVLLPLTTREIPIISDPYVDINFGTGALKITPAHDKNDYEVGKRHKLSNISVIGVDGKINLPKDCLLQEINDMSIPDARKKTTEELAKQNLLEKVDNNHTHSVAVCYKGGHDIEPTILPNWFIKVDSLKKPAHEAVKKGSVRIFPKWQEKKYYKWMEEMHDWPISRQVVWGIRIPAWYNINQNPSLTVTFLAKDKKTHSGLIKDLIKKFDFKEIEKGLQSLIAPRGAKYVIQKEKPGEDFLQETDTFDTWFSSGHWPLVCLNYTDSKDYEYFYPTNVLETGWEILRLWVSRMIMFGIYLTGKPPFKDVYLHGMVRAIDGRKMSKSLGNVINPEEYMQEFGVDALRMGLISGTANGKDFAFPRDKVIAFRNFTNKIWNIARFIQISFETYNKPVPHFDKVINEEDYEIINKLNEIIEKINALLEKYRFAEAGETIYHFVWDDIASDYLEKTKKREDKENVLSVLRYIYLTSIKLLHPFMPFVTEAIWSEIKDLRKYPNELLITAPWPKV